MSDRVVRIAGVDPAFRNTGVVIYVVHPDGVLTYDNHKVIHTKLRSKAQKKSLRAADHDYDQAALLARELASMLNGVSGAIFEMPPGGAKGARANRSLGITTGVLAAYFSLDKDAPAVTWVSPEAVKQVVGGGKATKEQVITWAKGMHPAVPWGNIGKGDQEHLADACGVLEAGKASDLFRFMQQLAEKMNG